MVLLGLFGRTLDPVDGVFDAVLRFATPATIAIALLAWTRMADRIGPMRAVRLGLGPLVVLVAAIGAGPADVTTLARPAAAPLIVLAMAFAAMTPGFPIAAVLFITRIGAERVYSELEGLIADLLTAQIAIALQNADLHARRRICAARSVHRAAQAAFLR